jgi:hypothetical protein
MNMLTNFTERISFRENHSPSANPEFLSPLWNPPVLCHVRNRLPQFNLLRTLTIYFVKVHVIIIPSAAMSPKLSIFSCSPDCIDVCNFHSYELGISVKWLGCDFDVRVSVRAWVKDFFLSFLGYSSSGTRPASVLLDTFSPGVLCTRYEDYHWILIWCRV